MGKSTISMAIFNSFLYVYQRVDGWDSLIYGTQPSRMYNGSSTTSHSGDLVSAGRHSLSQLGWRELFRKLRVGISTYGYGSIPIHTIFSGMNIHKSQLFWCELQGFSRFWHTATYLYPAAIQCGHGKSNVVREIFFGDLPWWMFHCRGRNPENGVGRPYHSPSFHIKFSPAYHWWCPPLGLV